MQHHGAWMCSLRNGTRWLPGPTDYRFNGNAFVFSLQATALNPKPGSTGMPDDDDDAGGGGGGGGGGVLEEEEMVVQPVNTIVLRKAHPDDPVPFCIAGAPRFCMWPVWQNLSDPS